MSSYASSYLFMVVIIMVIASGIGAWQGAKPPSSSIQVTDSPQTATTHVATTTPPLSGAKPTPPPPELTAFHEQTLTMKKAVTAAIPIGDITSVSLLKQLSAARSLATTQADAVTAMMQPADHTFPALTVARRHLMTYTSSRAVSTSPIITITPPALQELRLKHKTGQKADKFIFIDQFTQMMHLYESGEPIRSMAVSTGRPTSVTLTRSWQGTVGPDYGGGPIRSYRVDYNWYLRQGLYGGIFIHSVPYTVANQIKYYDQPDALGVYPSSHGCIRLGEADAAWLKQWNPVGAEIEITRLPGPIEQVAP